MPRPYTSPLQFGRQLQDSAAVNWGHPHSQDLRWFVAPTLGTPEDLVSGLAPVMGDYKMNHATPEGPGLWCPTSGTKTTQSAYWPTSGHLLGTWHYLTVVLRCIIDVLPTINYNALFDAPYNTTNASPFGAILQMNASTNTPRWNSSDAGSTDMYAPGTNTPWVLADGKVHEYAMAYDGVYCNFYRDGFQTDPASSIWFGSAQPILFPGLGISLLSGPYPATSPAGFQGTILCGGVWTRRLSTSELLSRWERPYQHLQAA